MADKFLTLDELFRELDRYSHKEFHVHHTWKPEHKDFNGRNHQALQNGMRNYHMNTNKWGDIAQHITLYPDGKILTGRAFNRSPISIAGYNSGNFMVEMIGNFDKGRDKFEGEQKRVALSIAKYFDDKGRYVRFHRENASKTCPGTGIDKTQFMREARGLSAVDKGWYRLGDSGSGVRKLQEDLKALTYTIDVDGSFGDDMARVVRYFQEMNGLTVDGSAGPATMAKVKELLETAPIDDGLFRVRSTWAETNTDKGAFKTLEEAIVESNKYAGYHVYDSTGKQVYATPKVSTPPKPNGDVKALQKKLDDIQEILNR